MCGRYVLTTDLRDLQARFDFDGAGLAVRPRYNVAPTQEALTVVQGEDGARHGELMRWGLVPVWAKDPSVGSRMINARAETVGEKPAFRSAFKKRRCLVLASGFYEWRREGAKKTPMFIGLKSGEPFAFAGLWGGWKRPDGEWLHSCTILTTAPNELMAPIHDRMPMILPREAEAGWLGPDLQDPLALLGPYPADGMRTFAVSDLVNSPKHDRPECVLPA
jgi:putative SOS response-associated peptidase YedK